MNRNGFTLLELVMILVIVAIIAVVAYPRMTDVAGTNAAAFVDKLRADIRYAQDWATTTNKRCRVYFNGTGTAPAAGYAVVQDNSALSNCSAFIPVTDPALSGNLIITLNTGQYRGITVAPTITCLEYDPRGQSYNCSANLAICSSTAAGMTVDVNGSAAMRVTVTTQTGAVN
jgi:prepilin-type N-terminal cleavage/methylation domain-containing protein